MKIGRLLGAFVAVGIALTGCGGGSSPRTLQSLAITPASASLPLGLMQQFTATGTFSDGSTQDETKSVSWTSGNPAVATIVANSGQAAAVAVGSTTVTATSGSVSASATLAVVAAQLKSIAITPNPVPLGVGVARQLTATGTYSDGSTADVTASVTWASSPASVASINSTGVITGAVLGSANATATSGAVVGTTPVSVTTGSWMSAGIALIGVLVPGEAGPPSTLLHNGEVLGAGSGGGTTSYPFSDIYNPLTNTWSPTASMSTAREGHTVTTLANGKVLAAGGFVPMSAGLVFNSAELFDPTTQTWSPAASMAVPRFNFTATLLPNGKVLVVGGNLASTELYDPASDTWSSAGNLPAAVYYQTATLLASGKVLVVGGGMAGAEIYDPVSNSWAAAANPTYARITHTATLLPNGRVLVAGGIVGNATTATAELYDPTSDTWSVTASMRTARYGHTATVLPSGVVMIVDGANDSGGGDLTSTEIYDPTAGTWAPGASTLTGRYYHSATLLPNGELLISGGDTNQTEVYW